MAAPLALYVDAPDGFRLLRTLTASGCVTEVEPLRLLRSPHHYDALLNALAASAVADSAASIRAAAASTTAIHSPPPFCPSSVPPCADAFVGARVAVAYDVRDENGAWLSRWFVGTMTGKTRRGWHVRFDDGDEKTLVKAYNVRVAVASYTRFFRRASLDVQAAAAPRRKRKRICSERTARAMAQRGTAPSATDGDVASAVAPQQATPPPPPALFSPACEALLRALQRNTLARDDVLPEDWEALKVMDLQDFYTRLDDCANLRVCACCGEERGRHEIPDAVYAADDAVWAPMEGNLVRVDGQPLRRCEHCMYVMRRGKRPKWALHFPSLNPMLSQLNALEMRLLRPRVPVVETVMTRGGQRALVGQSITFYNDIATVVNRLPRRPSQSDYVIMQYGTSSATGVTTAERVHPERVVQALLFLLDS
jgi:hypothetical protein